MCEVKTISRCGAASFPSKRNQATDLREHAHLRLVELLLGCEEADASAEAAELEEGLCCILARLPLQEAEAEAVHRAGGIPALTARISSAPRPATRRHALVTLTNLCLFPATRAAVLKVLSLAQGIWFGSEKFILFSLVARATAHSTPSDLRTRRDEGASRFCPLFVVR